MSALDVFHPAVRSWFTTTLGEPTPPQELAWPALLSGRDALVAAPTGSGKTLAAFLAALDDLVTDAAAGVLEDQVRVVYVSPLKALSNDIHKNLLVPMEALQQQLRAAGRDVTLRASVRTGDTSPKERAQAFRRPPHVLVTTPESLYVLLGSAGGQRLLGTARTLIVDEIHAVVGTRRGAHLALSMERLEQLCHDHQRAQGHTPRPLQRVGLSATQRPVEDVARFLVGAVRTADDGQPDCVVVNEGHARALDVQVEIPGSPLEAVMSGEVWREVCDRIADLVMAHQTTLVFVNTRRLAERVAAWLEERLTPAVGPGRVCAHHGSMSRERRFDAENRLKGGQLKVLVATSSLELGIDVGAVDLVCQLGTTRSIAALLQRVGRANHTKNGVPKGRMFPLSRDELVESVALLDAIAHRDLDRVRIPTGSLDMVCQHLVAMAGAAEVQADDAYTLMRRAWPYRELSRERFDRCVALVTDGVETPRGRRGARVFFDSTTGAVRGRRGARMAALTSGGSIPDVGEYQVVEHPSGHAVGTVHEDFAIESIPGDVFQLGTTSWRIQRVERGVMRVENAQGQPPTVPFWIGEAPARTVELSQHVTDVRVFVDELVAQGADEAAVCAALIERFALVPGAALQIAQYLVAGRAALGCLPTTRRVVFERFYDELGGAQIVIHAPFGARINRAWGLALRKRFCRSFDFELQAAATEDAILLSVGAVDNVDLTLLPRFLTSKTARTVLVQAVLDAPIFGTRFRWNATRALTMLRMRHGKRVPPGLQRIEAEDLLVSLFPQQAACLENIVGDREVPDELLVQQTLDDCLNEYLDIEGLEQVFRDLESGAIEVVIRELTEPSPLSHEVLSARPYAFLDDVPLEERRVQAVQVRRSLDAATRDETTALDARAVATVLGEVHSPVQNVDEAHDALALAGCLRASELVAVGGLLMPELVALLVDGGRVVQSAHADPFCAAVEKRGPLQALELLPTPSLTTTTPPASPDRHGALVVLLKGALEAFGPRTPAEYAARLEQHTPEQRALVDAVLLQLEREGTALRGGFVAGAGPTLWARRLVGRARRLMLQQLRAEIEPVSAQDAMRFLLRWQRADDVGRADGPAGLRAVLLTLDGTAVPAAAWEEDVLPLRVRGYQPQWLDELCLAGEVGWARLVVDNTPRAGKSPLRNTPVSLFLRDSLDVLPRSPVDPKADAGDDTALSAHARAVHDVMQAIGAAFVPDLVRRTRLLPEQVEAALGELCCAGLVTSDTFAGLRGLVRTPKQKQALRRRAKGRVTAGQSLSAVGRWSRVEPADAAIADDGGRSDVNDDAERALSLARLLLRRTGVVVRRLLEREAGLPPWRELLVAFRRLEARGEIRGGRFIAGFTGEQFALPEALSMLRALRREGRALPDVDRASCCVVVSAADPLNLTGVLLPGERVPAVPSHRILIEDGIATAVLDAGGARPLVEMSPERFRDAEARLQSKALPPRSTSPATTSPATTAGNGGRQHRDRAPVTAP